MKRNLIDSKIIFDKLQKDPEFLKEQELMEPQFQIEREIIRARIASGLSQRALAKKIDSTQAVISRIESGSVSPSINTVGRIAMAFGKKVQIRFVD